MRIYVQIKDGVVANRIVFDDAGIPDNWPDRASFHESDTAQLGWLWDGATFTEPPPAEPAPPPPIVVPATSAKLVLDDDGLYTTVEAICKSHPVNAVRIFWETASAWVQDHVYVLAIAQELNPRNEGETLEDWEARVDAWVLDRFNRALLK